MEVKTEADADCMILEYPHDDKCFIIFFICIFG